MFASVSAITFGLGVVLFIKVFSSCSLFGKLWALVYITEKFSLNPSTKVMLLFFVFYSHSLPYCNFHV